MIQIRKIFAYQYKEKHIISIPEKIIQEPNWKSDIDPDHVVSGNKLVLQKKRTK